MTEGVVTWARRFERSDKLKVKSLLLLQQALRFARNRSCFLLNPGSEITEIPLAKCLRILYNVVGGYTT